MTNHASRLAVIAAVLLCALPAAAQRRMEFLTRGVVAIHQGEGKVFVGWRMLGNEPDGIAFNLYRSAGDEPPAKLNREPLTACTNFSDTSADLTKSASYFATAVLEGKEQTPSTPFTLPANPPARQYVEVPLKTPSGYAPGDASAGDLDGDGDYDLVVHMVGRSRDNAHAGVTDPPILHAYRLDGGHLWSINLGRNIREGAHYTQFIVYDLDCDGFAEVVCKTADGTVDGEGKVIGDAKADWVGPDGRVMKGPEFLTLFDGRTGAALHTVHYIRRAATSGGGAESAATAATTTSATASTVSSPAPPASTAGAPAS